MNNSRKEGFFMSRPKNNLFQRIWKGKSGYLFILPKFILFTIFVAIPIVWSFFVSFQDYGVFDTTWVGLENFATALQDDLFWTAMKNTVHYAIFVMPAGVITALILASLINPLGSKRQTFFRA